MKPTFITAKVQFSLGCAGIRFYAMEENNVTVTKACLECKMKYDVTGVWTGDEQRRQDCMICHASGKYLYVIDKKDYEKIIKSHT